MHESTHVSHAKQSSLYACLLRGGIGNKSCMEAFERTKTMRASEVGNSCMLTKSNTWANHPYIFWSHMFLIWLLEDKQVFIGAWCTQSLTYAENWIWNVRQGILRERAAHTKDLALTHTYMCVEVICFCLMERTHTFGKAWEAHKAKKHMKQGKVCLREGCP